MSRSYIMERIRYSIGTTFSDESCFDLSSWSDDDDDNERTLQVLYLSYNTFQVNKRL